ncbi:MAG: diguanylate cyclase domain-containing protein [Actinomycetota bacterium]
MATALNVVGLGALVGLARGAHVATFGQLGVGLVATVLVLLLVQRTREAGLNQAVQAALQQVSTAQEQGRRVLEALDQGVAFSTLDGEILLLNAAGERILGYGPDELTAMFRSGEWETYREDGTVLPAHERPLRIAMEAGEAVRDTVVVWHTKSGTAVTLRVTTQPVCDAAGAITGLVTAFSDITAERAAARAVEATQARFEALVEQSSDIICLLDAHGSISYASPAGERVLGHAFGSHVGTSFGELLHPDDIAAAIEAFQELLRTPGSTRSIEARIVAADGKWRHFEVIATNRLEDPAVNGVVANLRDVTDRTEAAARLTWQAFHDPLTKLPNRALLIDRLDHALERSRRGVRTTALMFVDLDGFKSINDTLGHAAGDELLVEVASRLSGIVRVGDTVSRLGGDEFIVLAESLESPGEATAIAARIVKLVSRPMTIAGRQLEVTASVGVAFDTDHEPDRLLREADNALYQAKALGKNRFQVYGEESDPGLETAEVLSLP